MAFEKGKSGNPGGRPKEKPFLDALTMELKARGDDHKALRQIAGKLVDRAIKGDMAAALAIADRLDGKPAQAIENADGEAFNVVTKIVREIVRPGDEKPDAASND